MIGGGKGDALLSCVPGKAPAEVVIVGGHVRHVRSARFVASALECVYLLDWDLKRLQTVDAILVVAP
ncbi:MAG: hypothetical protein U0559_09155 [Anaerolineae bacterium]